MCIKMTIGLFLGFEYLILEYRKEGVWKVNLPKLILMVIPSLCISISWVLYYYGNNPAFLLIKNSFGFVHIAPVVFGFSLITCFYKVEKSKNP